MPDTTSRFDNPLWPEGKPAPWVPVNQTLERISGQVQTAIEDRHLADPPASPAEGSMYLVAGSAISGWFGQDGNLAHYSNGGWVFYAPIEGWIIWVKDENRLLLYDTGSWRSLSDPLKTIDGFFPGTPGASAKILIYPVTDAAVLPANFLGSQAWADVAATAQADFDVQRNGVSVGTIRWAAAAQVATFIAGAATNLVAGDRLHVIAPATPDATLADIAIALRLTISPS